MTTLPTNETRTPPGILATIIGISAVASLFLFWLIYFHPPADVTGTHLLFLPALNALLNALSAIALFIGFLFIRAQRSPPIAPRCSRLSSFRRSFSSLHHQLRPARGDGFSRTQARSLGLLPAPHLPYHPCGGGVADDSHHLFPSLSGRFPAHRRLARWTFPDLALRLRDRRHCLRHARVLSVKKSEKKN